MSDPAVADFPAIADMEVYSNTYLKIRDKHSQIRPLHFNPVQKRLWAVKQQVYQSGRPRRFIILKARREGITTLEMAHSFWTVATQPNRQVVTLGHEDKATEKIFRIATLFYEKLGPEVKPKRLTAANKRDINLPNLRGLFSIGTAGTKAFSRGDTLDKFHWTEVAWSNGDKSQKQALLAGLTEAASHGEGVLESTPNGVGDLFHDKFREAYAGKSDWTALFFTWWDDPTNFLPLTREQADDLRASLDSEEMKLALKHRLTLGQIAWRRSKVTELGRLFPQEYPEDAETCFLVSGTCFFNKDVINALIEGLPVQEGEETQFAPPVEGRKYVAGMDSCEGIPDRDAAVMKVIDAETEEEMFVLRGCFSPEEFARRAVPIAVRYNMATLVPERNNHGHSTINTLMNEIGYPNIYVYLDYDPVGRKHLPKHGWETNSKTRPILLNDLREHVEKGWYKVRDRVLLEEMRQFGPNKAGKLEALNDAHDDTIFASGMAVQGRKALVGQTAQVGAEAAQATRFFAPVGQDDSGRMGMHGRIF